MVEEPRYATRTGIAERGRWVSGTAPTDASSASRRPWNDGRDVPDTTQSVIDYQRGARMLYDATLANSFDAEYDTYYGTSATVMLRDRRGWMFKEVDSPLLGGYGGNPAVVAGTGRRAADRVEPGAGRPVALTGLHAAGRAPGA